MVVTKVHNAAGEVIQTHETATKPKKPQIKSLLETFEGSYVTFEDRTYPEDVQPEPINVPPTEQTGGTE